MLYKELYFDNRTDKENWITDEILLMIFNNEKLYNLYTIKRFKKAMEQAVTLLDVETNKNIFKNVLKELQYCYLDDFGGQF